MKPLIPPAKRGGNRRHVVVREVVNGLMYILSTGCQWRAIPTDLPPRSTLYDYFDLWSWGGTLDRIHDALYAQCREAASREANPTAAIIDSQSVKSEKKGQLRIHLSGYVSGQKIKGKKRHILVDTQGLLMHAIVHAADVQDRDGGALVMASLLGALPVPDQALCRRRLPGAGVPERDQTDFGAPQRRDRQAVGSSHTLRRAPKALDRRTHIRLARPLPTTRRRTGNASTTRRSPSSASLQSVSCCENYAIPHDVLGQTSGLRRGPFGDGESEPVVILNAPRRAAQYRALS